MAHHVIDIKCPGCGAPVSTSETTCKYCYRPILISSFNSVRDMALTDVRQYVNSYKKEIDTFPDNSDIQNSVGMCYLKLKMYQKAYEAFEKAIEDDFDNSETYFYAAVSLLNGKKPFLHQRSEIDKITELLNAAIMIEPLGIYYYFFAYVKYDYFERKFLNSSPDYAELLQEAKHAGYSEDDKNVLCSLLDTEINL